ATGVAPSTAIIVVNNFERLGLVYQRRLRSVKMIMLNPENPVAGNLVQLVQLLRGYEPAS
ncbi:MAG: hypothetical protein QXQ70_09775, partial [Candidatus Caldarchaeum sp.]